MGKIPLSKVYESQEIRNSILKVIDSGNFILGPESGSFEKELACYLGVKRFVLSNSWTSAVYLLLKAMNIEEGKEILLPSLTAFPSVEPICHVGLKPVFVDIDETYCMDPDDLRKKITPESAGILPVHLYGQAANMEEIMAIAEEKGLFIIEDCAQAIGAKYNGKQAGSLTIASGFSFYPSKNLTVYGDGGGIATNDDSLADEVVALRNHGRKSKFFNDEIGFNMRFNEIQAVVGRCQLRVIDELNAKRRKHAARYSSLLQGVVKIPEIRKLSEHVFHMYVIEVADRDKLRDFLKQKGIGTGIHYPVPVHKQPAIINLFGDISLPKTEEAVDKILSLPMFPDLTEKEIDFVAGCIKEFTGR
ncbi:DegT/DnrJ/EryC1/StrS family aminotransferase [bacterium]|jgi:dTDP-4-amino-4,6-dideoxygalactose transaminase|nr:DegT/DnrJ/EryC1/StrS family aminotransferase [bacterium]